MFQYSVEPRAQHRPRVATAVVLGLALLAAGCGKDDRVITSSLPQSYEDRHPIVVGHTPVVIDVAADPSVGRLTDGDRTMVYGFVRTYRNEGQSALQVHTPAGAGNEAASQAVAAEVRQIATQEGIPSEYIAVYPYHASGRDYAPVRLSYSRLNASTPQCGLWPTDISGTTENRDYENFGCAHQSNLATMVNDPRDLLGPRGSVPRDSQRRSDMFEKWRTAQDTATQVSDSDQESASEVSE